MQAPTRAILAPARSVQEIADTLFVKCSEAPTIKEEENCHLKKFDRCQLTSTFRNHICIDTGICKLIIHILFKN
jgi:hypothetical protein